MKTFIVSHYQKIKGLYVKYERLLMPAMLVVGFLVDYFTFTNIQISITFALLFFYWVLAGTIIIFIPLYDGGKVSQKFKYVRLFSPLALQFAFGALLSASLVFYWFSGAFSVSWPLVGIIILLMVFNDTFRHYFEKSLVQISVYFFATISLFSLLLPFLFSSLSVWLFIGAGAISLVIFTVYIYYLGKFAPQLLEKKRQFFVSIIAITIVMNVLYFTNIIPPIPLALREAGMYHSLKVSSGRYAMAAEPENFLQSMQAVLFGQTMHIKAGATVYAYTAIFAPAKLQTTIVHHWQYYDPKIKNWITKGKLPFDITGGRKEGYKGYSYESKLAAGKWRVSVENQRGQVLGRVRFRIENVSEQVLLQEIIK